MLIDCNRCEVRGVGCSDCVVSALLGVPDDGPDLSLAEQQAIAVLADAGLVPPLRLIVREGSEVPRAGDSQRYATG